ncbi:MAG: hypothetical protein LIP77_06295 [Planctomycetes bacterium]|nr:hypothetical protein [Planctomycetota bacterium]
MAMASWNWKGKDGGGGTLLYESGNWGDILKMLWLLAIIAWRQQGGAPIRYFDPFAGEVRYPLGRAYASRIRQAGLSELDGLAAPFLQAARWPSCAAAARFLIPGPVEVFDADPERRARWRQVPGVTVLDGTSGWEILARREPDPDGLWLVDPYDFLAEWRQHLDHLMATTRTCSVLLYLYNRSARSAEAFRDYRAFRSALDEACGERPKWLGRVAADAFLPRSHHEVLFLPGESDRAREDLAALGEELGRRAYLVAAGLERAGIFHG